MTSSQCLQGGSTEYSKFMIDDRGDKTRSTQNFSKLCQNCRLIKDQLQAEIFTLKDKSHQSFMQVIQVQQLHEEQMELMKAQHQEEIAALRQEISRLEKEVQKKRDDLVVMEKNSKRHICDVEQPSFLIENIEMIECRDNDEGKDEPLDQSSVDQFNEIVESKVSGMNSNDPFLVIKQVESKKNVDAQEHEQQVQKLQLRVLQLESQVFSLWSTNQELKKQCIKLQTSQKSIKNNYDSLYKESKFMADHIRNLANDKFKLERKVKQFEKELKQIRSGKVLKKSSMFEDKNSMMSIKINGSDMFMSQELEMNVRNSLESSREEDLKGSKILPQGIYNPGSNNTTGINNDFNLLTKVKSTQNMLKTSITFPVSQPEMTPQQPRKSMPNYKKISHISPSFKKPVSTSKQPKQQPPQLLKIRSHQQQPQLQQSDFMDEIRKEIEIMASVKKSHQFGTGNGKGLFHSINDKRK